MTEFDPFDPHIRADPFAHYARLQAEDPVHWCARRGVWIVTRHADAAALLADPRAAHWQAPPAPAGAPGAFERVVGRWLALMAPAGRSRLRAVTVRLLAPASTAALAREIETHAGRLIDAARERGELDVVADYADPLALGVLARQFGLPRERHAEFAGAAADLRGGLLRVLMGGPASPEAESAAGVLSALIEQVLADKSVRPGDDLLSALVAARDEDGIERDDFTALALVFLFAGHENITNFIATAYRTLLLHPEQYGVLRQAPHLASDAVEELLRYESPVQYVSLTLRADVELGGRSLAAGQQVLVGVGAANRDPAVFHEPQRLDLGRAPNPHLSLGHGPFFCIGATLARLEARLALQALVELLEAPALVEPEPRWRGGPPVLRGLAALPVRFAGVITGGRAALVAAERHP